MNKIGLAVLALVITLAGPLSAQADADAAAGKAAYAVCAACHGPDGAGNVDLNAPAIAGQHSWYLARQLGNFKGGVRGGGSDAFGAQMAPMAMSLATDEAVANVAAYVASLAPTTPAPAGAGDASTGETLFGTCIMCHAADAKGNIAMNAPNLTLLQDWYIVRQLQNFRSGARGAHADDGFGAMMAPMAKMLPNDQALQDVAAYVATLR